MYQAARGTTDILPGDQPYWEYVRTTIARVAALYGFQRIDTPIFEDTGLFKRSVGEGTDIVQKEMYTFDDLGGNSLTLRPEGTAPVCRAYVQHGMQNLPQPVKLYYVAPLFRYERPQAGRYRQHHQFGCEAFGEADPMLDAEVIAMAWSFYKELGLTGLSLQLNSIGCRECRPGYLAALTGYYNGHTEVLCRDCAVRLENNPLRLLDCKQVSCQQIAEAAPKNLEYLCPDCAAHFQAVQHYLNLLGIPFQVNHRLVRGLDYYTRTVFEIQPPDEGGQSTIGGGGRFDNLIEELGGKPTPAVGFATGIERTILNLKKKNIVVPPSAGAEVLVARLGDAAGDMAITVTADLRAAGIRAITATGGRSLKAQLRQANSLGVRYTVIIGEDEVKAGAVTLRHMADAGQETVSLKDLSARLNK